MTFLTLDTKGAIAAIALGIILYALDGFGFLFVLFMLYFLVLAAIVTVAGRRRKKLLSLYQDSRGVANVVSNGFGPAVFAAMVFVSVLAHSPLWISLGLVGFGASVASITADKFSSEIGVLDGFPHDIFNMRKVRKGSSGGVTALGLLAGLLASILIALPFAAIVSQLMPVNSAGLAVYVVVGGVVGGFAGTLVDSMLGHYEEKGIGNKFTSNFFCSIVGGIVGMMVLAIVLV